MRLKTALLTLAIAAAIVAASAAVFIYSGAYDIAASGRHTAPVAWALGTLMEHSVRAHAEKVTVPSGIDLRDRALGRRGFPEYDEMCALCHGAPGVKPAEWIQLVPEPPDLSKAAPNWTDAELYWIVKNGIKMSGMPAFGGSHKEEQLWELVAFVRQLPRMSAQEYRAMAARESEEHKESHSSHSH